MKFLCQTDIPKGELEEVQDSIGLFQKLLDRNLISRNNKNFLSKLLSKSDRHDLVQLIGLNPGGISGKKIHSSSDKKYRKRWLIGSLTIK